MLKKQKGESNSKDVKGISINEGSRKRYSPCFLGYRYLEPGHVYCNACELCFNADFFWQQRDLINFLPRTISLFLFSLA